MEGPLGSEGPDGRQGRARIADFPVGAVLDDQHIQSAGLFHQRFPLRQAQRPAGRIVEIRDDIEELGLARRRGIVPGGHDPGAVGPETLEGAEIGRRLRQDDVAGIRQDPGRDVDALLGGCRYLDLRDGDAVPAGDDFPEFRHTLGRPVLERPGPVFLQHLSAEAFDLRDRER